MKYSIEFSERKTTSTGKQKIDADLKDMAGETHNKVSIWADFPGFATLMTGHFVEGDIVTKQNGQNVYKNLYPPRAQGGYTPRQGTKPNFTTIMDKKNENIKESQEHKDLGIKTSSTMNKAVDLAIAELNEGSPISQSALDLKNNIKVWRTWLWNNWDYKVEDNEEPFI